MSDPESFLDQMQGMLDALQNAQDDLDEIEVTGTAGGGAVRVHANCVPEITRVEVSAEALEDAELLGDLIVVAVNDALGNAAEAAQERLGGLAGGLGLGGPAGLGGLGGLDPTSAIPGLGKLFGELEPADAAEEDDDDDEDEDDEDDETAGDERPRE